MEMFAKTAPAEVAERIKDADIVITNKVQLNREAIVEGALGAKSRAAPMSAPTALHAPRIEHDDDERATVGATERALPHATRRENFQ